MNRSRPDHAVDPPQFVVSSDDFSVHIALESDPHFWWRVEPSLHPGELTVTDFMPGAQDDPTNAAALAHLIAAAEGPITRVIFHDLVPQPLDAGRHRIELNRVAAALERWSAAAAHDLGCRLGEVEMDMYRDKTRMIVTLE